MKVICINTKCEWSGTIDECVPSPAVYTHEIPLVQTEVACCPKCGCPVINDAE